MGVTHLPGADFLQIGSRWQKWADSSSMILTHASIGIPAKPLQTKWTNKNTIGYYNKKRNSTPERSYSQTPLIRALKVSMEVSALTGCSY